MTTPQPPAIFATGPDLAFRLSAAERARVPHIVDAAALEQLLSWVVPENRAEVLQFYQHLSGEKVALGPAFGSTGNSKVDSIIERIVVRATRQ